MVSVSLANSASDVGDMFEDLDLVGLASTSALASIGYALTIALSAVASALTGTQSVRILSVVLGVAAVGTGTVASMYGGGVGDAMAIGSMLALGSAVVGLIVGGRVSSDDIRTVVDARMPSGIEAASPATSSSSSGGCTSCGPSKTTERQTPQPQQRRARPVAAGGESHFR